MVNFIRKISAMSGFLENWGQTLLIYRLSFSKQFEKIFKLLL